MGTVNGRIHNSTRNVVFGLIKYSVSIIFPFITRTILIYRLGTEYAGISSLFTSILQVLNLSELGFSTAVVFALYEPVAKNDIDKICALLTFFRQVYKYCGIFIFFAGICVCPFVDKLISGTYPSDINIYLVFFLLLVNTSISYLFCGYKSVLFAANQRDDILSKSHIISNFIMYGFQIIALIAFSNYYLFVVSIILGTLFNNLCMHLYAKKMYPGIICRGSVKRDERKRLIQSIKSLFGHQLDMVIITSADNIVISMFLGLNVLTIYNNYYYILSSLLSVLIMISNSFAGSIGNSIAIETKEKNYKNFIDFTYFIGMLSSICTILMFVLYQDFMKLWMGDNRLLNNGITLILCISFYVRQFRRSVITYKIAAGAWSLDALKPYIAAIVNLVLNILSVQYIGLYGVIISTIVSMIAIEAPWEIYVLFKQYFKTTPRQYLCVQGVVLIKTIVIGMAVYFLSRLIPAHNMWLFIIKALLFGTITVGLYVLVSFRDKEFIYMMEILKRKRKG